MIELDPKKLLRQMDGVDAFFKHDMIGTLWYIMQFGKSYTAKLILDRLSPNNIRNVIIVTNSISQSQAWEYLLTYVANYSVSLRDKDIQIMTSNSIISSNLQTECMLMIVDEIHNYTTGSRFDIIDRKYIKYTKILGLTGTFPTGDAGKLLSTYAPVIDTITAEEAIANDWIAPYTEYNLGLELGEPDKLRYHNFSVIISEMLDKYRGTYKQLLGEDGDPIFKSDMSLIYACYGGKAISINNKKVFIKNYAFRNLVSDKKGWYKDMDLGNELNRNVNDAWHPDIIDHDAKVFTSSVQKRNDILINNSVKLRKVVDIFDMFRLPTLCFNESIMFAEKIEQAINDQIQIKGIKVPAVCYHSKIKSRPLRDTTSGKYMVYKSGAKAGETKIFGKTGILKYILDGIEFDLHRFISTAKALNEGTSIPLLKMAITTAGDTNPIHYQQRIARLNTIDFSNPNKHSIVINLYFNDFTLEDGTKIESRDKHKLIARQSTVEHPIYWISSLSQINVKKV